MKKIPDSITIGPYKISVGYEKNMSNARKCIGEYYPQVHKILIDPDCSDIEKLEVFIHECVEATLSIYDLEISHHFISLVGTGLVQALKDVWVDEEEAGNEIHRS